MKMLESIENFALYTEILKICYLFIIFLILINYQMIENQ